MGISFSVDRSHFQRPLLLCFSHLRWNFVFQRPQHLLSRALQFYDVVFMEEPVREHLATPTLRNELTSQGVVVLTPVLPETYSDDQAVRAQRNLLDSFLDTIQTDSLVAWYYAPMALAFTAHLRPDVTVYDCMDELSAFKSAPPSLRLYERELFKRADVVFTGGASLHKAKRSHHHNVHLLPSSIDASHFIGARSRKKCPPDVAHITGPKLGFFGVIDERMDMEFLRQMAQTRPNWNFVMIGPVVKIDGDSLPALANIHWMGGRSYDDLPDYISTWDVGLMPFAINEATRFISPTKTPEFLAAGCPVVSTPIADVVTPYGVNGLVEIAASPAEAIASSERLMQMDREPWLAAVDRSLEGHSWDNTWKKMNEEIAACTKASRSFHDYKSIGAAGV